MTAPYLRCRRHGKQAFGNQETAQAVLDRARSLPPRADKVPVRCYRASCGFWHLTSKALRR